MSRGVALFVALASAIGAPLAGAQPPLKRPLVATPCRGPASPEEAVVTDFRQGLRDRGWIESQNVAVEIHDADWKSDRVERLAAERRSRRDQS